MDSHLAGPGCQLPAQLVLMRIAVAQLRCPQGAEAFRWIANWLVMAPVKNLSAGSSGAGGGHIRVRQHSVLHGGVPGALLRVRLHTAAHRAAFTSGGAPAAGAGPEELISIVGRGSESSSGPAPRNAVGAAAGPLGAARSEERYEEVPLREGGEGSGTPRRSTGWHPQTGSSIRGGIRDLEREGLV